MASGWASDDAVQEQIDSTIAKARSELPKGESVEHCEECGEPIPEARRKAIPGVRLCIKFQQEEDAHESHFFRLQSTRF